MNSDFIDVMDLFIDDDDEDANILFETIEKNKFTSFVEYRTKNEMDRNN